jgi:tetratricopeptide (TPR) repeat protein
MNTRSIARLALLLTLPATLLGCPPGPYRLGQQDLRAGQYYDAAQHWIEALDEDIYQTKPRNRLAEYSPAAWEQQRSLAQEHEASGRYAEAAEAYETLFAFEDDLKSVELFTALEAEAKETRAEYEDTLDAWAEAEFTAGVAADKQSQWEEAIGHFEKVRELDPAYAGLDERRAFTYLLWAEEDLAKHRYQAASDHYHASFDISGKEHAGAWASAIDVALARYALGEGKCRTAVQHFEKAGEVLGDPTLDEDQARAEDCARIGILVEPVTEEVEFEHGETALASMLVDLLEREIDREGSRFVKLLSEEALEKADNPPERQIRIRGRITQAVVEEPSEAEENRTVEGRMLVDCDKETLLYEPDAVCTAPVDVEYTHHRTAVIVRMAGSVKIIELSTGEKTTRPLDIKLSNETTHATDFRVWQEGTWVPTQVGPAAEMGRIEVPDAVRALDRKPDPLPPESQLVTDAIAVLAEVAGASVLETVDAEEPPPPPKRLTIREPKLLPEDVTFARPPEAPEVEAIPDPEPEAPAADEDWAPPWTASERKAERARLNEALAANDPEEAESDGPIQDTEADLPILMKLAELALWEDPGAFEDLAARVETFTPDDPRIAVFRIALRARMGLYDKAEARFQTWLDEHPGDGLAWKYYGLALADQKKPEARSALENAQRLGFDDDYVTNTLEMVYAMGANSP